MNQDNRYDCIIVGGGLAGLSLSVLLAKANLKVLVIEKKSYPFHKVCGEYISMESWDFLLRLGLPLETLNLPKINRLRLTSIEGTAVEEVLEPGGFGLSRYELENMLFKLAAMNGVTFTLNTTASVYKIGIDFFQVTTSAGIFKGKILCAAYGKHAFGNFHKPAVGPENWVGVKYHIRHSFPDDSIALHNFNGGYCGISKIENQTHCLCYLVKASQLRRYANQIKDLEQGELYKNPYLKDIFEKAQFLFEKPLTVSNVTFSVKKPIVDHVFYLGDSAGTIAPLSGNGMSNAFRSANILSECIVKYIQGISTMPELEHEYTVRWHAAFRRRITSGRLIQYFFCKPGLTRFFILIVKYLKPLRNFIIQQTHGESF